MDEASRFFQALYSNFIFRDIVAKIIPGLIAVASIIYLFRIDSVPWVDGISAFGIAIQVVILYAIGFAVGILLQFIGMKSKLTVTHVWPADESSDSMRRSVAKGVELLALEAPSKALLRKRERMIVLKEMMGNYGIALLVLVLARVAALFLSIASRDAIALTLLYAVISILLIWHNRELAKEQQAWEAEAINQARKPDRPNNPLERTGDDGGLANEGL